MMKSLVFKALLVGLILLGLGNYALYLKTGRVPDFSLSWPSALKLSDWKSWVSNVSSLSFVPEKSQVVEAQTIYKWQDEGGAWTFSSEAPAEGILFEKITADANLTVIPAVKTASPEKPTGKQGTAEHGNTGLNVDANPYSVQGIQDLLQKSNDVQKKIDDRSQQQKEILEKL